MAGIDLTVEGAYFRKVCFSVPLLYYNIYIFEDGEGLFSKVAIYGFSNCRTLQDHKTLIWLRPMSARLCLHITIFTSVKANALVWTPCVGYKFVHIACCFI